MKNINLHSGIELLHEHLKVSTPEYIGLSIICFIGKKTLVKVLSKEPYLEPRLVPLLQEQVIYVPNDNQQLQTIIGILSKSELSFFEKMRPQITLKFLHICNQCELTIGEGIAAKTYYQKKMLILIQLLELPTQLLLFSFIFMNYTFVVSSPIMYLIELAKISQMKCLIYVLLFVTKFLIVVVTGLCTRKVMNILNKL